MRETQLLTVLPLAFYLALVSVAFVLLVDDAFISLRYAQNLAAGNGLVFNPGDAPTEGYTNFLLVIIEAFAFRLGGASEITPKVVGIVAGSVLLTALAASRRDGWGVAAALLVATSTSFIVWTTGGLETVLFAAFSTGGVFAALRRRHALAQVLLVLAALTRPEGMLFWLLVSIYQWSEGERRAPLVGGALLGIYHLWRLAYFGSLLPLTFTAKDAGITPETLTGGFSRLLSFLAFNANGGMLAAALGGLWLLRTRRAGLLGALIVAYILYVVSRGGDIVMDGTYRLYTPLIPLLALALAEAAPVLKRHISTGALAAILITICLLRVSEFRLVLMVDADAGAKPYQISWLDGTVGLHQGHIAAGRWLEEHADAGATIVLHDAGAIPYLSGLHTIDTWSLTDPAIIRMRRNGDIDGVREYVLAHAPDYIVQDQDGLLLDPDVRAQYEHVASFTYLERYRAWGAWTNSVIDIWQRRGTKCAYS